MNSSKKGSSHYAEKIQHILQYLIGSSQEFDLKQQFFHLITFWTSILAPILLIETHIFTPNVTVESGVIFIGLANLSLYLLSRRRLLFHPIGTTYARWHSFFYCYMERVRRHHGTCPLLYHPIYNGLDYSF